MLLSRRAALVLLAAPFAAITQDSRAPAFEVASIRPSGPDSRGPTLQIKPGGRVIATGFVLTNLITLAFGVDSEDLLGAPSWTASTRYDIEALSGKTEQMPQTMLRLQRLLADRFQLQTHRESRRRKALALAVHPGGIRFGPAPGGGVPCPGNATFLTMPMLGKRVSTELGLPVVDQTGLPGWYCISLKWTGETGAPHQLGGPSPSGNEDSSLDAALSRQLGLVLKPTQQNASVLVVDRVSPPSPN
jgi:uncharacterized protein (TIGR03435 family)